MKSNFWRDKLNHIVVSVSTYLCLPMSVLNHDFKYDYLRVSHGDLRVIRFPY